MKKPPRSVWLDPLEYPPPRGNKINVLTYGGIATTGHWNDEDCAAWMPLADTPGFIKTRMMWWATGQKEKLREFINAVSTNN